jgi:hypothetical protein
VEGSSDSGNHKISFGRTAGTLVYEDHEGTLLLGFEISPARNPEQGKWLIQLGSTPLKQQGRTIEFPLSKTGCHSRLKRQKRFCSRVDTKLRHYE